MNIAICLSGSVRTFTSLKQNAQNNLIGDIKEIFTVLDEPVDLNISRGLYFNNQKLYSSEIDNFSKKTKEALDTSVKNTLQMFYRIYKCNQLKSEFEEEKNIKFDIVVRARPDLEYHNRVKFNFLNKNEIIVPANYNWGGVCDQFWYSDSDTSDIISKLYLNIHTYITEGCIFHPETLLLYHCNKNNIKVINDKNLEFHIVRKPKKI
jgi:hypothetical protein